MIIIDGKEWFVAATRNQSFFNQCLAMPGFYHKTKEYGIDAKHIQVSLTVHGTQSSLFMNEENIAMYSGAILRVAYAEPSLNGLSHRYESFAGHALDSLSKCLSETSLENWQAFLDSYSRISAGLNITLWLGRSATDALVKKFGESNRDASEVSEIVGTVTYPVRHTPLFDSQLAMLSIGKKLQSGEINDSKKMLDEWLSKYRHIPVNFCDEPWTMDDARRQLDDMSTKDCANELERMQGAHVERLQRKDMLLKTLDDETKNLATILASCTYLNEYRKGIISRLSLGYRPLFEKAVKNGGSENWSDGFYLMPDEMTELLFGTRFEVGSVVAARYYVGAKVTDGTLRLTTDEETERMKAAVQEVTSGEALDIEVRGMSANRGVIRGTVKIILSSRDFSKLMPGEILVTTMTSVDFVPVMSRAAAFVTNEGGVTSHASIVSREMNKPCIIGTKIATKVLKDGDFVEVDADRGMVTILKRAG